MKYYEPHTVLLLLLTPYNIMNEELKLNMSNDLHKITQLIRGRNEI